MSFCPTKDIHSVYLDNELPEAYRIDYEKHLSQCSKCRHELDRLKSVRILLREDSDSICPDKEFLDSSYQRLMIKMSYNKNSKKIKKPLFFRIGSVVSAAAAAVLLAVFVPIGILSGGEDKNVTEVSLPPVFENILGMRQFGNNISFGSGNNIAVSGNIDKGILSSDNYAEFYGDCECDRSSINLFDYMESVDALRPQFIEDEDNIISIKVTIPNVGNIPVTLDSIHKELVVSGNYLWNLLEE